MSRTLVAEAAAGEPQWQAGAEPQTGRAGRAAAGGEAAGGAAGPRWQAFAADRKPW